MGTVTKKGFSIIEILIVISVIMILLGVVIPRMKGSQDESNLSKAKSELEILKTAVESYQNNNNGALPENITGALTGATPQIITSTLWDPFITDSIYRYKKHGTWYVISSVGLDGIDNPTNIDASGVVTTGGDDVCITNGTGC